MDGGGALLERSTSRAGAMLRGRPEVIGYRGSANRPRCGSVRPPKEIEDGQTRKM